MNARSIFVGVVFAGIVVAISWSTVNRLYLQPRAELKDDITRLTAVVANYNDGLDRRESQDERLDSIVERTLGGEREVVDHELRTRLNRLVEATGLAAGNVNTGKVTRRDSPAKIKYSRMRDLKDRIDFVEIEATVSGSGTLKQAVELLDRIDAESWVHRVDLVRLDPKDNGELCAITVRLRTFFVPGRAPSELPMFREDFNPASVDRSARLVSMNPFRVPPPDAPSLPKPVRVTSAGPTAPPPFPYDAWTLTGIAQVGATGVEAWIHQTQTGERKRLSMGERLNDMQFEGRSGSHAAFSLNGEWFEVEVGRGLNQREAITH
jgi:hypothetical protein